MDIVDNLDKGKPLSEKEQRKANLLSLMDDIDDEESSKVFEELGSGREEGRGMEVWEV